MDSLENNEQITQDPLALTLDEVIEIVEEIDEQPAWRAVADKEMDYADGNQLDTDLLNRLRYPSKRCMPNAHFFSSNHAFFM